jgi:hypothetical protein
VGLNRLIYCLCYSNLSGYDIDMHGFGLKYFNMWGIECCFLYIAFLLWRYELISLFLLVVDERDTLTVKLIILFWQERIAKVENALQSIVHLLARQIGEIKLALQLLLELSRNNVVRDSLGTVQGCILLLVTNLGSDDIQASNDAQELLENLSFIDQNVIQMAKANHFKPLLQRLSSGMLGILIRSLDVLLVWLKV